jgi:hypothetical protein
MAQGTVTKLDADIAARVDEVKVAYAHVRRLMDRLIIIRNGTDYAAVATAAGAADGEGQFVFDNLDAALGGLTTANNALSNMDVNA